jgi:phage gpG-like protein
MTIDEMKSAIKANFAEVENYRRNIAPEKGAKIALEHFQASFTNQGFTDKDLKKWPDVKRRDPSSGWYGFEYGGTAPRPGAKKRKKGESVKVTNFKQIATKRKILLPEGAQLYASITKITGDASFKISSDREHASVHNFGEPAKIFGKKSFTMPKRQFIGHSQVLLEKMKKQYIDDLMKITGIK